MNSSSSSSSSSSGWGLTTVYFYVCFKLRARILTLRSRSLVALPVVRQTLVASGEVSSTLTKTIFLFFIFILFFKCINEGILVCKFRHMCSKLAD